MRERRCATTADQPRDPRRGAPPELWRRPGDVVVVVGTGGVDGGIVTGAVKCLGKGDTLVLSGLAHHGGEKTVELAGNVLAIYEQHGRVGA